MSKKYILAKDLPFAKRGTEVNVSGDRIFVQRGKSKLEACIDALELWDSTSENIQKELQRLINEGWVEEAKPREFKLTLNKDGTFAAFHNPAIGVSYNALTRYPPFETIKVREVLE